MSARRVVVPGEVGAIASAEGRTRGQTVTARGPEWEAGSRIATPAGDSAAFEYAVLRIVPRVDRGEFINGAVLLYCQAAGYLGVVVRRDLACVRVLAESADVEGIEAALGSLTAVVARAVERAGTEGEPGRTFRWLTAPRSAVVQPGPVHTGVTESPERDLARIAERMLG